jgi:hypothetical protein
MNLRGWLRGLAAFVVVLGGGVVGTVVAGFIGISIAARLAFSESYDPQFPGPGGEGFLILMWLVPSAFIGFWIGVFLAGYGLYKFNQH